MTNENYQGGQERDKRPRVAVKLVTEQSSHNPLSRPERPVSLQHSLPATFSSEGFAENPQGQTALADFYIDTLALQGRGPLLDVGFGANDHIIRKFANRGIYAYGLDALTVQPSVMEYNPGWRAPQLSETDSNITLVGGDVVKLGDPDSELKDEKFGTILFNGSWNSRGNNFTAGGEFFEAKMHSQTGERPSLIDAHAEQARILLACRNQLTDTGVLGVVSSRYANHGGGYAFDQYPAEKLSFLDLYDQYVTLGASNITVIGVSQEGFDSLIGNSLPHRSEPELEEPGRVSYSRPFSDEEIADIRNQMRSPSAIDIADAYKHYDAGDEVRRMREVVLRAEQESELHSLARIDAMFAEFTPKAS